MSMGRLCSWVVATHRWYFTSSMGRLGWQITSASATIFWLTIICNRVVFSSSLLASVCDAENSTNWGFLTNFDQSESGISCLLSQTELCLSGFVLTATRLLWFRRFYSLIESGVVKYRLSREHRVSNRHVSAHPGPRLF